MGKALKESVVSERDSGQQGYGHHKRIGEEKDHKLPPAKGFKVTCEAERQAGKTERRRKRPRSSRVRRAPVVPCPCRVRNGWACRVAGLDRGTGMDAGLAKLVHLIAC
jgi:hypothetical protein